MLKKKLIMYLIVPIIMLTMIIIPTTSKATTTYTFDANIYSNLGPSIVIQGLDSTKTYDYVISAAATPEPALTDTSWSSLGYFDTTTGNPIIEIPSSVYSSTTNNKVYVWVKDVSDNSQYVIEAQPVTLDFAPTSQMTFISRNEYICE